MQSSIFGPVPSRRLGRSLGVDLIPYKTCSFDCIYCELGPTTSHTKERGCFKDIDALCDELKERLRCLKEGVDFVTLAGSGEPTLNADLGAIISRIKAITDLPLAILTNSSLLSDPAVIAELAPLDLIVPSLDAASPEIFQQVNRPVKGIELEVIIEGLIRLREGFAGEIWLEVLLCEGINDRPEELDLIKRAAEAIHPDRIQINTVFRPPAQEGIRPVSERRLREIERFMGHRAQAVGCVPVHRRVALDSRSVRKRVSMLLQRRPCTLEDITSALCMNSAEVVKLLDQMVIQGEVSRVYHEGSAYYRVNIHEK